MKTVYLIYDTLLEEFNSHFHYEDKEDAILWIQGEEMHNGIEENRYIIIHVNIPV